MSLNIDKLESLVANAKAELEKLNGLGADAKKGLVYKHKKEFRKHLQAIKVEAQQLRLAANK